MLKHRAMLKQKTVAFIFTRGCLLPVLDTFKMARKGKLIHVCTVKNEDDRSVLK